MKRWKVLKKATAIAMAVILAAGSSMTSLAEEITGDDLNKEVVTYDNNNDNNDVLIENPDDGNLNDENFNNGNSDAEDSNDETPDNGNLNDGSSGNENLNGGSHSDENGQNVPVDSNHAVNETGSGNSNGEVPVGNMSLDNGKVTGEQKTDGLYRSNAISNEKPNDLAEKTGEDDSEDAGDREKTAVATAAVIFKQIAAVRDAEDTDTDTEEAEDTEEIILAKVEITREISEEEEAYTFTQEDLNNALQQAIEEKKLDTTKKYVIERSDLDEAENNGGTIAAGAEEKVEISVWLKLGSSPAKVSGTGSEWKDPTPIPAVSGNGIYSYPFEALDAAGGLPEITDENGAVTGLLSVPVVFADYKSNAEIGGNGISDAQAGGQFSDLNKAIQQYHNDRSNVESQKDATFKFPLYFGDFNTYAELTSTLNNNEKNQYAWEGKENQLAAYYFLNHNLCPDIGEGWTEAYLHYATMGITGKSLGTDGALLSRDGANMPYFSWDSFLKDQSYAELYGYGKLNSGSNVAPLAFPFRPETRDGDQWYVFDSSSGKDNVRVTKDENGQAHLTYNSADTARVKNKNPGTSQEIGFFPFNDGGTGIANLNYGFGMRLDIPFQLPVNGNGEIRTENGNDVKFEFTGDDDVWVFVDGILMLDLGGMHGMATGSINFTNQQSVVNQGFQTSDQDYADAATLYDTSWQDSLTKPEDNGNTIVQREEQLVTNITTSFSDLASAAGVSVDNLDLYNTQKTHTLTVYYMERGMGDSNLKVSFNYTPVSLTKSNGLTVTNTVDYSEINPAFRQELIDRKISFAYEIWNNTNTSWNNQGEGASTLQNSFALVDKVKYGEEGIKKYEEKVEGDSDAKIDGNVFTLYQSTQDSRFKTSYIYHDSNAVTYAGPYEPNDGRYDATDGKNVTGTTQPGRPPYNGKEIQAFTFPNNAADDFVQVDYTNVAVGVPLKITKNVEGEDDGTLFQFKVTYSELFGESKSADIPYQGAYTVNGTTKTATSGIVELYAGETAVIEGVPVFSTFKVAEQDKEGYVLKESSLNGGVAGNSAEVLVTISAAERDDQNVVYVNKDDKAPQEFYAEVGKEISMTIPNPPTGTSDRTDTASGSVTGWEITGDGWYAGNYGDEEVDGSFHLVDGKNTVTIHPNGGADINIHSVTISSSSVSQTITVDKTTVVDTATGGTAPVQGNYIIVDSRVKNDGVNGPGKYEIPNNAGTNTGTYCIGYMNQQPAQFVFGNVTAGEYEISINCCTEGTALVDVSVSGSHTIPGTDAPNITEVTGGSLTDSVSAVNNSNNTFKYTAGKVGDDVVTVTWGNGDSQISRQVIIHNYQVKDDIYVLDYGLPVDLQDKPNGIFENDVLEHAAGTAGHLNPEDEKSTVVSFEGLIKSSDAGEPEERTTAKYMASGYNKNGKFETANAKVDLDENPIASMVYTPDKFMSSVDTFYYGVQVRQSGAGEDYDATNATPVMVGEVKVMPATTVYYEDNFIGENNNSSVGIVYTGGTITPTEGDSDRKQDNGTTAADGHPYGYDTSYETDKGDSAGSVHTMVSKDKDYAKATFTFQGTGFDIVGRTTTATGIIKITIKDKDGNEQGRYLLDTYYQNGDLYQVPVAAFDLYEYGTYTVELTVYPSTALSERCTFYLDGIRIYNPLGYGYEDEFDQDAKEQYEKDNEFEPMYEEIRSLILGTAEVEEHAELDGAVFIDRINSTTSISEYEDFGPANEVYLNAGQSIAFKIGDIHAANKIQIGARILEDTSESASGQLKVSIKDANSQTAEVTENTLNLTSYSDMYYYLTNAAYETVEDRTEAYIVLTNAGSSKIALTRFKSIYKAEPEGETLFSVSTGDVPALLKMVNAALGLENDYSIHSVSWEKSKVKKNDYAKMVVVTGDDVSSLDIVSQKQVKVPQSNITAVHNSLNNTITWTAEIKQTTLGNMRYTVNSVNADGKKTGNSKVVTIMVTAK